MTIKSKIIVSALLLATTIGVIAAVKAAPADTSSGVSNSEEIAVKEVSTKPGKYGLPSEAVMQNYFLTKHFHGHAISGPEFSLVMKDPEIVKFLSFKNTNIDKKINDGGIEEFYYTYEACFKFLKPAEYSVKYFVEPIKAVAGDISCIEGTIQAYKTASGWTGGSGQLIK
ncbi:hypothetical protein L6261_02540 [Candidatus Parcubacteria bacterium]|nr:hypothetical protein [Candidatus Parcubacteria bacterium]